MRRRLPGPEWILYLGSGVISMTDGQFTQYVAGLLRAGGWKRVSVSAPMGPLGTDVSAVGADGRRWLVRCHRDATRLRPADVHRFADTVRLCRRGDVTVLITAGTVPEQVRRAAVASRTTVVDGESLAWWAGLQRRR